MIGGQRRLGAAVLVLACACNARSLTPAVDGGSVITPTKHDGSAGAVGSVDGSGSTGRSGDYSGASTGQGGAGGSATTGGGASAPLCPPIDEVGPGPLLRQLPAPPATPLPVPCRILSSNFMFPPPGADVPGVFSRCASFDVGAAVSVALSPDGGTAAMVTEDGLARIVDIRTAQVIAVLAPPRAMLDLVAYQPRGRAVLTLARAQREVTLWRASDWTPVWRVTLPGLPYYHATGGGLAFAPDGASAVVSPGSDTFLLDVATGAIIARRTNSWDAVLDVAYGWGGRRIVVAEPAPAATCQHEPSGGTVTVLDAATLAPVVTVADLGSSQSPGGARAVPQFRASPTDDLVLIPPGVDDPPGLRAYRLSNGGALPMPAITSLPAAFLPDGATVLMEDMGGLRRVRLADGVVSSPTIAAGGGPMAMSADGALIAAGGIGANILRVADASGAPASTICAGYTPTGNVSGPGASAALGPAAVGATSSLSFDGQLLALAAEGEVQVIRRADGGRVTRLIDGISADLEPVRVTFSPFGRFVVTQPQVGTGQVWSIFSVSASARFGGFAPDGTGSLWGGVAFSPRDDRVYSNGYRDGQNRLDAIDLQSGVSSFTPLANWTVVIGTSIGCPVMYESTRGAWRACGGCEDPPIGGGEATNPFGAQGAVLSPDGNYVGTWSNVHDPGVKLWKLPPGATRVAALKTRPGWNGWEPVEYPVAMSAGAGRILTGAQPASTCYSGPQFPIEVHDLSTGAVVDTLPPAPAAADGAVRTVAFGAQLWCARY